MVRGSEIKDRCLIQILVDHASPEAFFGWIDKGAAPNIKKYILGEKNGNGTYSKATISRNIVTGYPSTSANSHTSIVTGSYAGKNDLLYSIYWDLTGKKPKYVNIERMAFSSLKNMNTKHMNIHCKTLFEHVKDSASFHAIYRGASFRLFTTKSILFKFLPFFLKIKRRIKNENKDPMETPEFWKEILDVYVVRFLNRLDKTQKMPDASFIVFLLSDSLAHRSGFNSFSYRSAIEFLDYMITTIIEGLDDKKGNHVPGLKERGYLDKVIWNLCTDHSGRAIDMGKYIFINSIAQVKLKLAILEGEKQDIGKELKALNEDYSKINAFSTIGGELWHCWFGGKDGKSLSSYRKFHGEPYFRSVEPKRIGNNNYNNHDLDPVDLIDWFKDQEFVQFVIIPEENDGINDLNITPEKRITLDIPRTYEIKIFSKDGAARIQRSLSDGEIFYAYELLSDKDPLKYDSLSLEYSKFYSSCEWLEMTINHQLPDIFHRLFGFFDCIYAPNFIITSALDYHFLSLHKVANKKLKAIHDVQTHDGLFKRESIVPLTISGPGIKKGFEISKGRNIDVLPTLLEALGIEYDDAKLDGKPLKEILE